MPQACHKLLKQVEVGKKYLGKPAVVAQWIGCFSIKVAGKKPQLLAVKDSPDNTKGYTMYQSTSAVEHYKQLEHLSHLKPSWCMTTCRMWCWGSAGKLHIKSVSWTNILYQGTGVWEITTEKTTTKKQ